MGLEHRTARSRSPRRRRHVLGVAAIALAAAAAYAAPRPEPEPPPAPEPHPKARGKVAGGALDAEATLGQAKLVRGRDGELYLHVAVDAAAASRTERRPVDFALVLDTSGSMAEEERIALLRRATTELLGKLGPEDRVAIVEFSTEARTIFPLGSLAGEARRACADAVAALEPRGGTNISAGLLAGAETLRRSAARPGAVRRIVLMTDGLPTFGEKKDEELCRLANALAREGFTVSTIGLGLEYGEKLLTSMADSGGGAFHGADKGDRLARLYEVEVEAARALVARDARVVLTPEPGVAIESVLVWPTSDGPDGAKVVSLGDVSGGRHLTVVARLRVPTGGDGDTSVVRVALRFEDVRDASVRSVATEPVALGVELVADGAVAAASRAEDVRADLDRVGLAHNMKRVHAAALEGNEVEVNAALAEVAAFARDRRELRWQDADGHENAFAYDQLAAVASAVARKRTLESGAALEVEEKRLLKLFNSGAVVVGK